MPSLGVVLVFFFLTSCHSPDPGQWTQTSTNIDGEAAGDDLILLESSGYHEAMRLTLQK